MGSLPDYYSELAPFAAHFSRGLPSLCYHKIEAPPRHARIKGLYLSPDLFVRQIRGLKDAGFAFVPPGLAGPAPAVAITFDDGFASNWESALPGMKDTGCHAINFLVADRIGRSSDWESAEGGEARPLMNETQIREWMAAGNRIGAHTCTHPRLTRISRGQAKEEIVSSKKKLEDRFAVAVEHFAYPFGDYDIGVVDLVRDAGFKTASTMDRGINDSNTDPLRLKRWTARYPTRTIGSLIRKILGIGF
ncbi:MAG: polysaccharide deacetylase family protein [Verrucomicrobia bacterium]|nr:polysaccharide deacetylase family protein [Verrucomicrobiota bacterium]